MVPSHTGKALFFSLSVFSVPPASQLALPAGSRALPVGSRVLPAGSEALPAGSRALPAGSKPPPALLCGGTIGHHPLRGRCPLTTKLIE